MNPSSGAWKERGLWKASSSLSELELRTGHLQKLGFASCLVSKLSCLIGQIRVKRCPQPPTPATGRERASSFRFDSTGRHRAAPQKPHMQHHSCVISPDHPSAPNPRSPKAEGPGLRAGASLRNQCICRPRFPVHLANSAERTQGILPVSS